MRKATVVEGQVGEDAGIFVEAIGFDEGAFVFCMVHLVTL